MSTIEYRDFDGDLQALTAMASDSWFEEYGMSTWPDIHKPGLAAHYFADIQDPRYLIGAYDGARLVAFIANLPRSYRFQGQVYQGVISCMMIGHRDYRRRGIVLGLIQECLRRNEEIGRDFALLTLEKKHRSSSMFEKHLKPNYRIERLKAMYPIVRVIDVHKVAQSERLKTWEVAALKLVGAHRPLLAPAVRGRVRPYMNEDLAAVLELTRQVPDTHGLVRVFDEGSLAHQLHNPGVTDTLVYEHNAAVRGFVNYTRLDLVGPQGRNAWAWLDFLYWEGLRYAEKKALLAGLWERAREDGCISIMEWNKNYYGKLPLFFSRFVAYPRGLEMDAWMFNPDLALEGVSSVFEHQV